VIAPAEVDDGRVDLDADDLFSAIAQSAGDIVARACSDDEHLLRVGVQQ
jgi:hypothetical protein